MIKPVVLFGLGSAALSLLMAAAFAFNGVQGLHMAIDEAFR